MDNQDIKFTSFSAPHVPLFPVPMTLLSESNSQEKYILQNQIQTSYPQQMNTLVTSNINLVTRMGMMHRDAEPIVIDDVHNFVIWVPKSNDMRYINLLKAKMIKKIKKTLSFTRSISYFTRTKPIDCDMADFFKAFGQLPRYVYESRKKPKNIDKYHVKELNEDQFFAYFGCHPITKYNEKKKQVSKLNFPIVLMYNEVDNCALMDIRYKVYDCVTGSEVTMYKIRTSQDKSTRVVQSLQNYRKGITKQSKKTETANSRISDKLLLESSSWGLLQ